MQVPQPSRMAGIELLGGVLRGVLVVWEEGPGVVRVEVEEPLALDADEVVG